MVQQPVHLSVCQSVKQCTSELIRQSISHLLMQSFIHSVYHSFNKSFSQSISQSITKSVSVLRSQCIIQSVYHYTLPRSLPINSLSLSNASLSLSHKKNISHPFNKISLIFYFCLSQFYSADGAPAFTGFGAPAVSTFGAPAAG